MTARALAIALLVITGCGPAPVARDVPSAPPTETAGAERAEQTARPTASPSPSPQSSLPPRVTREIAGIEFVIVDGPADLRVEPSLSRADEALVGAVIEADIPAVEREFERAFAARPVIYVFATTEGYVQGFVRIFGYTPTVAAFVAENSISFFEPSLGLIAVNWDAIRGRRPITAIRHELTHLLTLDACTPRCDLVPAWLNEGQGRLAEALAPGGEWRLLRVRYESASMAETGTLIPLNTLVSQFAWNSLTDWAGYFKYQEAARAVELLREDVGGPAPMARVYERLRRGQNIAQAYAALTGRSFDDFVSGLAGRMRSSAPEARGIVAVAREGASPSYLLYGFAPSSTVTLTISGPRGSESVPLDISPFGATFDSIPATRTRGGYTVSAQGEQGIFTVTLSKTSPGGSGDMR
ncbi:MAG TPA: hypothetical protein VGR87_07025 [Candidatus Limnocylindria bacterium]|jgi:hypothetical protein|nr:hypothetical protein [Candidatus Limnocylindria bacterium]